MTRHIPQLVCLDLGGVMMRICSTWDEACTLAKVAPPASRATTADVTRGLAPFVRAHECGHIDEHAFSRQVADVFGLPPDHVTAASMAWIKEPYPGAIDLITKLTRIHGLRTACLSNTSIRHWRAMTMPGKYHLSLDKLTWRFASFEIGFMKPDAGIYEHVERVAAGEGIMPESIAFFDDNEANVAAAASRRWHAVRVDPHDDPPGQVAEALKKAGIDL